MAVSSHQRPAQPVEVEVLPSDLGRPTGAETLPRLIALFMDNLFRVPGTKLKFGFNPVLDLLPGIGDASAGVISAITLFVAARQGVPKVVLARMGLNILLNSVIGIIPVIGEAFAFWFRPSLRNFHLLQKHLAENHAATASTRKDWFFVIAMIAGILLVFGFCVAAGFYLFARLLHAIWGITGPGLF